MQETHGTKVDGGLDKGMRTVHQIGKERVDSLAGAILEVVVAANRKDHLSEESVMVARNPTRWP